ncbi:MAG TPA: hypothetical protein VEF72_10975 [Mycobacterium sp.]|nr:hypothetical protein [Mycobacterium sp.]
MTAWHALVAAIGGGVDLTDGCYVGRHSLFDDTDDPLAIHRSGQPLSSRLPGAGQVQGLVRVPAAIRQ